MHTPTLVGMAETAHEAVQQGVKQDRPGSPLALGTEVDASEGLRLGILHRLSEDPDPAALTEASRLAALAQAGTVARELRWSKPG